MGLHGIASHSNIIRRPVVESAVHQPTQWKKGLIIGGAFGLLVDVMVAADRPCETGDCGFPVGPMIASFFVFAVIGGLIGNIFKRH